MRRLRFSTQSKYTFPIVAFLHGAIIMAIVSLTVLSNYEDGLYDQIVEITIHQGMDEEQTALALLHKSHALLNPRLSLFGGKENINLRDSLFRSSDIQLIDARKACGSHTHVLGRLLQRAGIQIRIAQMKCGNQWGCHILLEANINGKWVSLDGLYDLAFRMEDGTLASFQEVGKNWEHFRLDVPDNYNPNYAYEDVRYTNWTKIPVVMPLIRNVLALFLGDQIETLSIRSCILNVYKTYLILAIFIYALLMLVTIFILRKKARKTESLHHSMPSV